MEEVRRSVLLYSTLAPEMWYPKICSWNYSAHSRPAIPSIPTSFVEFSFLLLATYMCLLNMMHL